MSSGVSTAIWLLTYLAPELATPWVIQQYSRGRSLAHFSLIAQIVGLASGVKLVHRGVGLVSAPAPAAVSIPVGVRRDPVAAPRRRLSPEHEAEVDEVSVGGRHHRLRL